MQTPRPFPDNGSDERRTVIGRVLNWLAPEGQHDDWLEPDRDPEPGACPAYGECLGPSECPGPEPDGCPHR
ncbi:hypothetical protein [Actinomadura xylanilytica]|uniref:hypothetical protein n=1 Tax=Actinomadura xylanilytica TaxID=887459 RepID=UPI00255B0CC2|nr:hypothetical protein [Actinomadura xylanilytica]MDL4775053.1 hypothetical protein [Actinomadura xylanilytica]